MTGVLAAGIGAGTMIMPPIANQLIANYEWRTSYFIVGCVCLVIVVAAAQFLRRKPQVLQVKSEENGVQAILEPEGLSFRETIRTRQFWVIMVVFFSMVLCVNTVMIHIVPHATNIGISATSAAGIVSVIGGLSIIGRLLPAA